jgi:molecular chaperone DnaK
MPGRVAVDFGTSKTVIACWDPVRGQGNALALPEYSRLAESNDEQISVIPSLIHYGTGNQCWYGNQVVQRNLTQSPRSFQWMKRHLLARNQAARKVDARRISTGEASEEFLIHVLKCLAAQINIADEEVGLTLPVEAFEHYEYWLYAVAQKAGLAKVRFIDEPSAAALAYSARLFPGESSLFFDFGAGNLSVSIVRQEIPDDSGSGRCRVLGKAGVETGGANIDEWLFHDIVQLNGFTVGDEEIQQISKQLLCECETLKERLSSQEKSSLTVVNPRSGSTISCQYSRKQLETLLEQNGYYAMIEQTLERALSDAAQNGLNQDRLKAVLLVGGCSLIPSVQELLKQRFGPERVKVDRPLDAVARGAAAIVAGLDFEDYLQHDYAVRFRNSRTQKYEYRSIVKRGSRYPSSPGLDAVTIKAVDDGQENFLMQIFEIGQSACNCSGLLELHFDESGVASLHKPARTEPGQRSLFWVNEKSPTLLRAHPPAARGEERFQVSFALDGNRRLLITTRDLKSGKLVHQDVPVVKLNRDD